jgi:hypothetical protein
LIQGTCVPRSSTPAAASSRNVPAMPFGASLDPPHGVHHGRWAHDPAAGRHAAALGRLAWGCADRGSLVDRSRSAAARRGAMGTA